MEPNTGPLVVVDLSNLCRDSHLLAPGVKADLSLLDQFKAALRASGISNGPVHSVADRSLMRHVPRTERRLLRDLEQEGELEFSQVADERILELAFGSAADPSTLVASRDFFDDFRRIYPEIQGSTDRFLTWHQGPDGELRVTRRDMEIRPHQKVSRKEESEELKARRLNRTTLVRRATRTYFRCTNPSCVLARLWPERLPDLPRYDDDYDRFVCPSCMQPLEEGEHRQPAVQLIVFLDGAEQFRVLLDEGARLTIGRRESSGCVGLQTRLPPKAVEAISREHLEVTFQNGRLTVEDLDSRNGTVYRLPELPDEPLPAGTARTFSRRGTVALPGGVTIEMSGRLVPLEDVGAGEGPEPDVDLRATRLLAGTQQAP